MENQKEEELKQIIAENLSTYRKNNNLTQAKLAEILNYSDKAVSKWERGDGLPDIFILQQLAELYHVTVNDLISKKQKKKIPSLKNKLIITLLSIGIAWLTAVVLFSILSMIKSNINADWDFLWLFFIYPIPISFIIALVFAKIWGKRWYRFFIVSGIIFGTGLAIYCQIIIFPNITGAWLIWIICAAIEVLNILWYCLRRKKKDE